MFLHTLVAPELLEIDASTDKINQVIREYLDRCVEFVDSAPGSNDFQKLAFALLGFRKGNLQPLYDFLAEESEEAYSFVHNNPEVFASIFDTLKELEETKREQLIAAKNLEAIDRLSEILAGRFVWV